MVNFCDENSITIRGSSEIVKDDYYKLSAGIECRLHGFSFYSYPSAIAYEYHHPISDLDEKGKHYFTLLFDY